MALAALGIVAAISCVDDKEPSSPLARGSGGEEGSLGPIERAEYLRSLDDEVGELRQEFQSLRGVRTSDIKSLLIYMYTGERVSGRTIRAWETTANRIELSLADALAESRADFKEGRCYASGERRVKVVLAA